MSELLEKLSRETGIRSLELHRLMLTAPERYKFYSIPKRTGGERPIAQPAREVKSLQRALVKVLLNELPVHPCASAYRPGQSILHNAAPHAGSGPILKVDLQNFFPSIKGTDWLSYCKKTNCLTEPMDIHLTTHLLFHRVPGVRYVRLAIGAPSSPAVSNLLMRDIDEKIFAAVAENYITYTRYADDMTFSAPRTGFLVGVLSVVAKILRDCRSPSLSINGDKTTHITTKFHRTVTGLTLSNDGRVTIGRKKKRLISASVHHAISGKLGNSELRILAGMLAYVNAVEPQFLARLRARYGTINIDMIQKIVVRGEREPPHRPPIASV